MALLRYQSFIFVYFRMIINNNPPNKTDRIPVFSQLQ